MIRTTAPAAATTNESTRSSAPGMIPSIASSQLVCPLVSVGSRSETSRTPPPSSTPSNPITSTTSPTLDIPFFSFRVVEFPSDRPLARQRRQAQRPHGPGQRRLKLTPLNRADARGVVDAGQPGARGEVAGDARRDLRRVRQNPFGLDPALVGQAGQPEAEVESGVTQAGPVPVDEDGAPALEADVVAAQVPVGQGVRPGGAAPLLAVNEWEDA